MPASRDSKSVEVPSVTQTGVNQQFAPVRTVRDVAVCRPATRVDAVLCVGPISMADDDASDDDDGFAW